MGEGQEKWVMGTEEGTCWDEHWVYVRDESRESIPKARLHCIHCMLANLTINYLNQSINQSMVFFFIFKDDMTDSEYYLCVY